MKQNELDTNSITINLTATLNLHDYHAGSSLLHCHCQDQSLTATGGIDRIKGKELLQSVAFDNKLLAMHKLQGNTLPPSMLTSAWTRLGAAIQSHIILP